jgi:hypothetical protein
MEMLWSVLSGAFGIVASIVWWLLSSVFWLALWFLLPFCVLAYGAMLVAEKSLGKAVVQAFIKRHALNWGQGTWGRLRPALFAVSALPFRVSAWLVVYALWHSIISLFWRPRWTPWQRAWKRRWRAKPAPRKPGLSKPGNAKSATGAA